MVYGSPMFLALTAMVFMSAGSSNATVTPPLVTSGAMGNCDCGKISSLAISLYYVGIMVILIETMGIQGMKYFPLSVPTPAHYFFFVS